MEVHNNSCVILFRVNNLFVISLSDEGKEEPFNAERWLNNIWNISFARGLVKIVKAFSAGLDVLSEVIVGSVRNAPKLAPTEREKKFKVRCCF